MKYFKSKITGSIFETKFIGDNYVHGVMVGKPPTYGYSATIPLDQVEEYDPEIRVGDTVKVEGRGGLRTVLAVQNQDFSSIRQWCVVAYKGDIPEVFRLNKVTKV